jgi:hypothetical protein
MTNSSFGFRHSFVIRVSSFVIWGAEVSEGARIESIDTIRLFRAALIKFIETCNAAMNDADSEMQQTLNWLEHEQYNFWQGQIRKRQDVVSKAKEAVRAKKLFKDSAGRTPSAVDEEKALRLAQVRLEEAEQKFANTRRYSRVLQKEIEVYKGSAQRFATTLQSDLPQATAMLGQMMDALDAYVSHAPPDSSTQPSAPVEEEQGGTNGRV